MIEIKQFMKKLTSSKEIYLNLENECFEGNVLDVGMDNHGIIYNLCKRSSTNVNVEYIDEDEHKNSIGDYLYDTLVLFFTIGRLNLEANRRNLLNEVTKYLKEGGDIIIWDVDKGIGERLNLNINVILPGKTTKSFNLRDYSLLKESRGENIKKFLESDFDIIEFNSRDNIYYIKGLKKGSTRNESGASSS